MRHADSATRGFRMDLLGSHCFKQETQTLTTVSQWCTAPNAHTCTHTHKHTHTHTHLTMMPHIILHIREQLIHTGTHNYTTTHSYTDVYIVMCSQAFPLATSNNKITFCNQRDVLRVIIIRLMVSCCCARRRWKGKAIRLKCPLRVPVFTLCS
jgi:hypothetical protein